MKTYVVTIQYVVAGNNWGSPIVLNILASSNDEAKAFAEAQAMAKPNLFRVQGLIGQIDALLSGQVYARALYASEYNFCNPVFNPNTTRSYFSY